MFAVLFFFFNDTATTEIYTLSLHDALPIFSASQFSCSPVSTLNMINGSFIVCSGPACQPSWEPVTYRLKLAKSDRKSTRLNSSHANISYAVFCLKKKKKMYSTYLHVDL